MTTAWIQNCAKGLIPAPIMALYTVGTSKRETDCAWRVLFNTASAAAAVAVSVFGKDYLPASIYSEKGAAKLLYGAYQPRAVALIAGSKLIYTYGKAAACGRLAHGWGQLGKNSLFAFLGLVAISHEGSNWLMCRCTEVKDFGVALWAAARGDVVNSK